MSHALFGDLAHDFNLKSTQCQRTGKQIASACVNRLPLAFEMISSFHWIWCMESVLGCASECFCWTDILSGTQIHQFSNGICMLSTSNDIQVHSLVFQFGISWFTFWFHTNPLSPSLSLAHNTFSNTYPESACYYCIHEMLPLIVCCFQMSFWLKNHKCIF